MRFLFFVFFSFCVSDTVRIIGTRGSDGAQDPKSTETRLAAFVPCNVPIRSPLNRGYLCVFFTLYRLYFLKYVVKPKQHSVSSFKIIGQWKKRWGCRAYARIPKLSGTFFKSQTKSPSLFDSGFFRHGLIILTVFQVRNAIFNPNHGSIPFSVRSCFRH